MAPAAAGQPGWLATFLHWELGMWQAHRGHLTVATVLIQAGIGVTILGGGDSWAGRLGLRASVAWGLAVWLMGEGLGGLLGPGASVIPGAPGAVLAYVFAAGLLLAATGWWESGRARRAVELGVGGTFLLGVLLQTIPAEGFWGSRALGSLAGAMAATRQPGFLADPIRTLASWAAADPLLWNTMLITVMAALGAGFCLGGRTRGLTIAAVVWLLFTGCSDRALEPSAPGSRPTPTWPRRWWCCCLPSSSPPRLSRTGVALCGGFPGPAPGSPRRRLWRA